MNSNINVLKDAVAVLRQTGFEINYIATILPDIDLGLDDNQAVTTMKITDLRKEGKKISESNT